MISQISDNDFLDKVEDYTSNQIQKKDDIKKIINEVIINGNEEEFEKLTFTAKYIAGMMRVLKSAPGIPEVTSIEHVKNDLNENMKKGIEQLKSLIDSADEEVKVHFHETYFILSTQNFSNLTQLFSDLEAVKKYLNYLKRQN